MDFAELEAAEGLRWTWNSWPSSRSAAADLVVPLSILATPLLSSSSELPLLSHPPLLCSICGGVLNPYCRVDQRHSRWHCPFCKNPKNPFPNPNPYPNLECVPPELFPTHSTVEYLIGGDSVAIAIVFVVDACTAEEELSAMKREILGVIARLPDNVMVGLVSFREMVWVHDLGFSGCCTRVVVIPGDRELSSQREQ